MENGEKSKQFDTLFFQMVLSLHASAWQNMGKVINPITNKIEKKLDSAAISIDMLTMLKSKTKGNLRKDEEEFLNRVLSELQLNFVSEKDKLESENSSDDKY